MILLRQLLVQIHEKEQDYHLQKKRTRNKLHEKAERVTTSNNSIELRLNCIKTQSLPQTLYNN